MGQPQTPKGILKSIMARTDHNTASFEEEGLLQKVFIMHYLWLPLFSNSLSITSAVYKKVEDLCYKKVAVDTCETDITGSLLGTYQYIETIDQIFQVKGLCFDLKQHINDMKDSGKGRSVNGHQCGRDDIEANMDNLADYSVIDKATK